MLPVDAILRQILESAGGDLDLINRSAGLSVRKIDSISSEAAPQTSEGYSAVW
jgi:hypothetical protein